MDRRTFLALIAAATASPAAAEVAPSPTAKPFSRKWLVDEAQRLAQAPFKIAPTIPEPWLNLSYDEFQHIWFDAHNAIWMDEDRPLKLDLFTAGLYFDRAVQLNVVEDGVARALPYDLSLFTRTDMFPDLPIDDTMGYSGVRLRAELNTPNLFEEFMVFQGGSYFRAIGNKQTYGLSARGLALRTGDPSGEEFPDFTQFWIEAADPGDTSYTVHALLDGPSTTGAFTFTVSHGLPTIVDVQATLFPRVDLLHVGLAPLTSMFLFDETNRSRFDDFRPAVHDSEGLLIVNGNGERIWRPLANHQSVQVSAFVDENPKGFGLMQRTRDLSRFADLEARYEQRPSLWIKPDGDWGKGTVELVEIPSDREIYDNIVAYWRPREPMMAGSTQNLSYRMEWGDRPNDLPDVATVLNTRIGKGFDQVKTVVTIDFEDHPGFADSLDDITILVRGNTGEVAPGVLQRNPATGGVRLAFSFNPGEATSIELRAQLFRDNRSISEVWLYRWTA